MYLSLVIILADEAIHKELGDSLVRAAATASSLKVEQDSGDINKTQSKAIPNESSSQRTNSGGGLKCQETMRDTIAQTRFENVSKHSNDSLLARVLELEKIKTTQHIEFASLKRRVKKLERRNRSRTYKLKRLYKIGLTARVESSRDEESLGEDASEQERRIDAIDADEEITVVNVQDNAEMFDVNVLDGEEVFVTRKNENVVEEVGNATQPKKKDQIRLDEEAAKKLQAKFVEEERLAREKAKKEQEANIILIETWDDIQAKIDTDHQLAKRLQAQEQEELSDAENAILFQQLLEKRRKNFAAKRVEEKKTTNTSSTEKDHVYLPKEHGRIQAQRFENKVGGKKIKESRRRANIKEYKEAKEDEVWKLQQGYKVVEWKLHDSCRVHSLMIQSIQIYVLVEKKYPLTPPTLLMMLEKKLQIDSESEMAYQLCKLVKK
nr:hypothetical protein [Tanacetum cinerariifolium]